jgi:hypothetical protein
MKFKRKLVLMVVVSFFLTIFFYSHVLAAEECPGQQGDPVYESCKTRKLVEKTYDILDRIKRYIKTESGEQPVSDSELRTLLTDLQLNSLFNLRYQNHDYRGANESALFLRQQKDRNPTKVRVLLKGIQIDPSDLPKETKDDTIESIATIEFSIKITTNPEENIDGSFMLLHILRCRWW